ncbi:MAG: DUF6504 family protein [Chloroflexota bacterium]|nr:DUF6504 family protein [Chloroflexota bacterium]
MKKQKLQVKHFIAEEISVYFDTSPLHRKSPPCPNAFAWRGQQHRIVRCLSEWKDFNRRGRMARNMQPQHAAVAAKRGSWGVGRFYFEVETDEGSCFRLYYDRAPKDAEDREGHWVLLAELSLEKE